MPSPVVSNIVLLWDRLEPKYGLDPRFEALPKPGKSPKSPRGVRTKALTPPPQQAKITDTFRLKFVVLKNFLIKQLNDY